MGGSWPDQKSGGGGEDRRDGNVGLGISDTVVRCGLLGSSRNVVGKVSAVGLFTVAASRSA